MFEVKKIWKEGKIFVFFRGNGLNVMKVVFESVIRFYVYEMFKGVIMDVKGGEKVDIGIMGRFVVGGLVGVVV